MSYCVECGVELLRGIVTAIGNFLPNLLNPFLTHP